MRSRRTWTLATLATFALSAAASGLQPVAADPCRLITRAEAERTLGPMKGEPRLERLEHAALCSYDFVDGGQAMELWLFPASGFDRVRASVKELVDVPGLGFEAVTYDNVDIGYVDLFVRKGGATLQVSLKEWPRRRQTITDLARTALARM